MLMIDDGDSPLTLSDERIERAIAENQVHPLIIDPIQAFLGADVDMKRANEVRPVFRRLSDIAQRHACTIILIGYLSKTVGAQSTYRSLGSIDMTAAVRSLLFIRLVKNDPATRVLTHEKSSFAPSGKFLAFSLSTKEGFSRIGEYAITADELLSGEKHVQDTRPSLYNSCRGLSSIAEPARPDHSPERHCGDPANPLHVLRKALQSFL